MDTTSRFHELFKFCPKCKQQLNHLDNHVTCKTCDFVWYNNPAVATSIALIKDKKILLAKRKKAPSKGAWDMLGGFVDPGETVEEGIAREMKEETGLDIEIEKYIGSVADIYNDLPVIPLIFKAKLIKLDQEPIPQDDVEELAWFSLEEIPNNLAFKNTKITIEKLKEYLK